MKINTIEKCHSFVGSETDEFKVIFAGLGWEPTNIWTVWFEFDWPHIFVGGSMSLTNIHALTDEYRGCMADMYEPTYIHWNIVRI
jgi:hypothetical protein